MKKNLLLPAILLVGSIICIIWIIPAQSTKANIINDLAPATFPTVTMAVIAGVSLMLIINALMEKTDTSPQKADIKKYIRLFIILAVIYLYVVLVFSVGYYSISLVALIAVQRLYSKMRWRYCLLSAGIYLGASYALFELGLRIVLPRGILF